MLIFSILLPIPYNGPNDKVIRVRALAALIGRFWTGGN